MPDEAPPSLVDAASAQALLERIVATPPVPVAADRRLLPRGSAQVRSRRRLRVGIAAVATLGAAAGYALVARDATKTLDVACYSSPSIEAGFTVESADGRSPLDACAAAWRAGRIGAERVPPPLTACVLESGVVGVFPSLPSEDTCARLGIPSLAPVPTTTRATTGSSPTTAAAGTVTDLRNVLSGEFLSRPCLSPDEAAALAQREIARLGLAGWTVVASVTGPFPSDRPCASYGFDEEQRRVLLIPIAPRR